MSKSTKAGDYTAHLRARLADVEADIGRAEGAAGRAGVADNAAALTELAQLRTRHDDLVRRLDAAEREGASDWSGLHASFREEADAIADTLEDWLTRHE